MPTGLIGCKYGMTRIFTEAGESIPVTVLFIDANRIAQIKTTATDGYSALQVVAGTQLASRINKPLAKHFAKSGVQGGRIIREFRLDDSEMEGFQAGQELNVDVFQVGQRVDISGITKGKGFAGTIKRHHFRSQDATHGNSLSHRVPGSVGMNQSPGRVFRGKKMAGQLGNVQRTAQNQEVVHIDAEKKLLFVKGAVPGAIGGYVLIKRSVKGGE